MTQLWRNFSYLIPLVLGSGLVVGTCVALVSWARVGYERSLAALMRAVLDAGIAVWALAVAAITLLPTGAPTPGARQRISLVPGADIARLMTSSVSWEVPFAQIGGNLVLFAAGGALVALRHSWGIGRVVFASTLLGIGIEASQTLVGGRWAVVDDVLLTVVGATLGAWAAALTTRYGHRRTKETKSVLVRADGGNAPARGELN